MTYRKPSGIKTTHSGGYQQMGRCYESHPALDINGYKIYGGSCAYPVVKNADVYVGFDYSMAQSPKSYPWDEGYSFLYHIQDMGVPSDPVSFKKLIEFLSVQLIANKLVHIGCIGGHGRTGMVLSALVMHMTGNKDAISYVRKNYCEKAVESASQVRFLMEHFGINEVEGYKDKGLKANQQAWANKFPTAANPHPVRKASGYVAPEGSFRVEPTKNPISVWG